MILPYINKIDLTRCALDLKKLVNAAQNVNGIKYNTLDCYKWKSGIYIIKIKTIYGEVRYKIMKE